MDNKDNDTDDETPNQLPSGASSVRSTTSLTSVSASTAGASSLATSSKSSSMAPSRSALAVSSSSSSASSESSRSINRSHSSIGQASNARGHAASATSGSAQLCASDTRDRATGGGVQRNRYSAKACSNAPHNSSNSVGVSVRNSMPINRHEASSNASSNSRNRHREGRNVFDAPQVPLPPPLPVVDRQKESVSPELDNDCASIDDVIPTDDDLTAEECALAIPIVSRASSSYTVFDPSLRPVHNWQASKSTIKERLGFMFNNELLADIHFVVGKDENVKRIAAHKFVLSIGSAVFDAMFNGGLHMSSAEIELPDVEPAAFLSLLWFFYTDEVNIGPDTVMTSLYTAKKYAVPALERACVDFLKRNLSSDNAFMLLTQARLFDEPQLAALCLEMIDKTTTEALSADSFIDIDLDTLCTVLERDTLGIRECKLFAAVCRWAEAECARKGLELTLENQRSVLGGVISLIRFPLMTVEEFAAGAAQSGLLTDREVVQLFLYYTVNPQPAVNFSDVPRCCLTGKEQVVSRFYQIENRWGYSGTSDRIRFMVNRRIFVVGFGLYGSIHSAAEYQVNMQIIQTDSARTCGANDTTFVSDGSAATFRVLFKEPIEIQANTSYTACATIKGPDSYYGTKGSRKVTHESIQSGKVTFQFTYAAGNNNGTSVEDGQLPEIVFYT